MPASRKASSDGAEGLSPEPESSQAPAAGTVSAWRRGLPEAPGFEYVNEKPTVS